MVKPRTKWGDSTMTPRAEFADGLQLVLDVPFPPDIVDSTIALHLSSSRWVLRRLDQVEFIDTTTTRKTVRLEIELPRGLARTEWSTDQFYLVPLGVFRRDIALRGLTVRDESGNELSTLIKEENSKLMMGMLHRLAGQQTGTRRLVIPDDLVEICAGVRRNTSVREDHESSLPNAWSTCLAEMLREKTNPEDVALRALIIDLWMGYLNVVALPVTNFQRRTITLVHEERLASPDEVQKELDWLPKGSKHPFGGNARAIELGFDSHLDVTCPRSSTEPTTTAGVSRLVRLRNWTRRQCRNLTNPAWTHVVWGQWSGGDAASVHVEIQVPPELEIVQATMSYPDVPPGELDWKVAEGERRFGKVPMKGPTSWRVASTSDNGSRGHLMPTGYDWWLYLNPEGEAGPPLEDEDHQFTEECRDGAELRNAIRHRPQERPLGSPKHATSRGEIALFSLLLAARNRSMLIGAALLWGASAALLLLVAYVAFFKDLSDPQWPLDGLVTILVFAPTVAAAVAAQPTAHEISGELVRPLRSIIGVLGALPVFAAVLLVTGPPGGNWLGASAIKALLVIELCLLAGCLYAIVRQGRIRKRMPDHPILRPSGYKDLHEQEDYADDAKAANNSEEQGRETTRDTSNKKRLTKIRDIRDGMPHEVQMVLSAEGLRYPVAMAAYLDRDRETKNGDQPAVIEPVTDQLLVMSARRYAARAGWDLD